MNRLTWRSPVHASIPASTTIDRITGGSGLSIHSSARVGPAWPVALYRRS
jgi:hypothetical protein